MATKISYKKEYQRLLRENKILKGENKYLKKLTTSKRFHFAEKVANGYNGLFPKDTKRRKATEKISDTVKKVVDAKINRNNEKISNQINLLVQNYQKIIVLNSIPWDTALKQRPHHLADEFYKLGFFVIYLEYDNPLKNFRMINDGFITVNSEKYILEIPKTHPKNCYFLTPNNMPTPFDTLTLVKDSGFEIIYDYLDEFHEDISGDLSIQKETWDKLSTLSPVLCTATAKRLQKDLEKHLGKKQKIISASNAVDVDHFDYTKNLTKNFPLDLKPASSKPIIGFYGALAPWIDFALLNKLANEHQEWNFVYLGIDYNGAAVKLKTGNNVFNLGAKNYNDLPRYAKFFNCAIIPFKHGEIAKATSPVKLFEYMASGLPTICTRDLSECAGYKHVYMSKNEDEFVNNIKIAIKNQQKESVREELLNQAKQNTWAERAKAIAKALD